jgi:N-acetylmuramoyl-L-alanine amidase
MIEKIRITPDVKRIDGDYSKTGTDIRILKINPQDYDIQYVHDQGKTVEQIAKEHDADYAINFPYHWAGVIIGYTFSEQQGIVSYDTEHRFYAWRGFGIKDGQPYIGKVSAKDAFNGVTKAGPVLSEDGKPITKTEIKRYDDKFYYVRDELVAKDIVESPKPRIALGINSNGEIGIFATDGWNIKHKNKYDRGVLLEEIAKLMNDLGFYNSINGDGGGSVSLYVRGEGLVNTLQDGVPRVNHHAWIFKKKVKPKTKFRIAIDAGHGPETPGKRVPDDSMREFHFNSVVADDVREQLEQYENVEVMFTHAPDQDIPLKERTDKANEWKADVFVSIHANAIDDTDGVPDGWDDRVEGIETFVYTSKPKEATALAAEVQNQLLRETGRKNRGVKAANLHVLRETDMTAILVECGFMTNHEEAELLKSDAYRRKCKSAIVQGLAIYYKLKKKKKQAPTELYRVQVGAFSNKENAKNLAKELQGRGYQTIIKRG